MYENFSYICKVFQNRPVFPGKNSIRHIRRLSKAITGALYPVLSDLEVSSSLTYRQLCGLIIVKPLINYVMMEKKYQLVAWTKNINDKENARLYMIPSLESEVQASLISDLAWIHKEEYKCHGAISLDLAIKAIKAYENMSRFEIFTGHPGDGVRYLFFAAQYCIWEDDSNWTYWDTDRGCYPYFCGELRHEFVRLCEEGLRLAKKYRRKDILQERKPRLMLDIYDSIINSLL